MPASIWSPGLEQLRAHRCYKHFRSLLAGNWMHFETNHFAEQDYFAVVLLAPGNFFHDHNFAIPNSQQVIQGITVHERYWKMYIYRKAEKSGHMMLSLDRSFGGSGLSSSLKIVSWSINPIFLPIHSNCTLHLSTKLSTLCF